ncbi:large subunit ribosomal protein L25 [Gracilibacillus ureilyticus]|uniref:Large ribosomal subunit protein bL25 n=1 Tax=Gracilibacillus ureilyticus TaxID=531814 RepID=A0A1H9VP44_9BACI|nr:50S ribosomal protein L25/general stress protein Ctc [Gracilibacillus ureilyticus]SES22973.1 large subunit ribosomal protein L25 [Gracilibacillus ureilyticus]
MAVELQAENRDNLKSSYTREVRVAGRVPAIIYGYNVDPKPVAVDSGELLKTVRDEGRNAIISLKVGNDSFDVMLHEYQQDPLKGELVHADFYVVNMSAEIDVQVPVVLEGEAAGTKAGGVLQQPLYELSLRAKPNEIPENITINVSDLEIGDSILISDLRDGKNYEILEDENTTVVSILVPDKQPEEDVNELTEEPEATEETNDSEE